MGSSSRMEDGESGKRKGVVLQFRDIDPIDLDLHLLDANQKVRGSSLDHFTMIPMRLPLPLMFRLLKTAEGRNCAATCHESGSGRCLPG